MQINYCTFTSKTTFFLKKKKSLWWHLGCKMALLFWVFFLQRGTRSDSPHSLLQQGAGRSSSCSVLWSQLDEAHMPQYESCAAREAIKASLLLHSGSPSALDPGAQLFPILTASRGRYGFCVTVNSWHLQSVPPVSFQCLPVLCMCGVSKCTAVLLPNGIGQNKWAETARGLFITAKAWAATVFVFCSAFVISSITKASTPCRGLEVKPLRRGHSLPLR